MPHDLSAYNRKRFRQEFGFDCRRSPARGPDTIIGGRGYWRGESGQYWSPADGNGKLVPIVGAARQAGRKARRT